MEQAKIIKKRSTPIERLAILLMVGFVLSLVIPFGISMYNKEIDKQCLSEAKNAYIAAQSAANEIIAIGNLPTPSMVLSHNTYFTLTADLSGVTTQVQMDVESPAKVKTLKYTYKKRTVTVDDYKATLVKSE